MHRLSEREADVLMTMAGSDYWVRPMDIGGSDASHHSATLRRLVSRGYVERRRRSATSSRPSYEYRITDAGNAAARAEATERSES